MNKVTEGLISALRALPKEDKKEAIVLLLDDDDFKVSMSSFLLEKLTESQQTIPHENKGNAKSRLGRRESGKKERGKYISRLKDKGIAIEFMQSIWGKTTDGLLVAIPFANEQRRDKWFLGVGEIDYINKKAQNKISIILLCKSKSGELMDFIISPTKVVEIIPYLTVSKNGQYLFNLRRDGLKYQLLRPKEEAIDLTGYKSNISPLK